MERGWRDITPNCPRCGSSNTKFCYYNNYSLTQPRYFCKGCRRYWTKGGSLRNVPVGGGCRKSRRSRSSSLRLVSAGPLNHHSHHGVTNPSSIHTMPIFGNVGTNTSNIQILPHSSYSSSGNLSNMVESSTQPMNTGAPTIDLAAVYANFLNQKVAANNLEQSLRSSVPFCDHVDNNTNGSNMQSNVDLFSSIPDATTIVHSNQVMDPQLIPFSTSQTLSMPQIMSNDHDHSRFFDRVDFNTVRDAPMQHEVELELPPLPGESSSTHNVHQEMHWITSNNINSDVDNLQASQDAQFSNLLIGSWMSPSLDLPGFETSSSPSKPT